MKAGGNERNEIRRSNSRPEMANLSLHQLDKYPRDLLQRFMSTETARQQQAQKRDKEIESQDDIELNLGLSLGGRFGVDKNDKKLIRSSSVAASIPIFRDDDSNTPAPPQPYPSLVRTASLPTETEEEWRKRKELQMLRRMEAKRRRSEKQKSSRERNEGSLSLEEEKQQQQQLSSSKGNLAVVGPPFGLPTWLAAARKASSGAGGGNGGGDGGGTQGLQVRPSSQGSGESSSMSEPQQGSSSCGETRSSCSPQSLQEPIKQEVVGSPGTKAVENPSRTPGSLQGRRMNSMEEMPCVFTKGDGPNGRRVEGILYRCGKREEVRIMCVCHGIFHSPAEFVKHAGGGDVDNPLRHIVVNTSSSASFS